MTPTDVRTALLTVADAAPVPPPDRLGVQRRVTRARRRRTTARVVAAAAAVAVVAGGSAVALRPDAAPVEPTRQVVPDGAPAQDALVLDDHLAFVGADGTLTDTGVRIAHLVGATSQGVVAFAGNGDLVRIQDGSTERLVDDPVRTAYLQGDGVVYQDFEGSVQQLGSDVSTVDPERLVAAGPDSYVVAGDEGLVAIDASGAHPLWMEHDPQVVRGVDVGGERIAARTDRRLYVFDADGLHSGDIPDDRLGRLSPDGSTYAHQTADRDGLELLDPGSFAVTPVREWDAPVTDLRWSGSDLLVVVGGQSLWRCPGGTGCTRLLDEPGLRLD